MKNRFAKLIDLKTIITLGLIGTVCYLAIANNVQLPSEFLASIVTAVITYYFTRKEKDQ